MSKSISNIKGINIKSKAGFSHDLQPVTVITGPNARGKTAVVDAVKVAVLGYHPALGKQPGKSIALAPDAAPVMEAAVRFSDGTGIERSFKRTASGAALKTVGDEIEGLNPAQLHFEEFVNSKPTDRHAILSKLMGTVDIGKITGELTRKVAELGLAKHPVKFVLDPNVTGNPLSPLVELVGEQAKYVGQSVKQGRATLATLVAGEIPCAVNPVALADAQHAVLEVQRELGAADAASREIDRRMAEPMPQQPGAQPPRDEDMTEADLKFNELTDAVNAIDIDGLKAAVAENQRELNAAMVEVSALSNRTRCEVEQPEEPDPEPNIVKDAKEGITELERQRDAAQETATIADQNAKTKNDAIQSIKSLGKCDRCGSTGKHLEVALKSLEKEVTDETAKWTRAVSDLNKIKQQIAAAKVLVEMIEDVSAAWARYREARARVPAESELRDASKRVDELQAKADAAQAALDAATETARKLAEQERAIERIAALNESWERFKQAKAARPTEAAAIAAHGRVTTARTGADAAAANLSAMRAMQAEHDKAVADQQRIADLTKESADNEATGKNLAALKTWVQQQERDATEAAMGPLLKLSGVFLDGIVNGSLAVQAHQLGIRRDGQFLPLEVLSGMECAAVAAACQAAMASTSSLRVVIVDELGRMRDEQAFRFWENCDRAVHHKIVDQVILVDPHSGRYPANANVLTIE